MSILARIFIAAAICPVYGGVIGHHVASLLARWQGLSAGATARWAMTGLLVGACMGAVFAVQAITCSIGRGEQTRRRVADPVLIALSLAGIGELLANRGYVSAETGTFARIAGVSAWVIGFVVMWIAARHREPDEPDYEPDEGVELPFEDELEEERHV